MSKLFISHSAEDERFVRQLRAMLAERGEDGWIDSRELRGGSPLWTDIRQAIEQASGYAVVVSPEALRSKWVGKELCYALKIRDQGGKDRYPIIPLSLDGARLGVLEDFFGDQPVYVPVSGEAGGVAAAMNAILVALGKRAAGDGEAIPQPKAEPVEDLVLELTDPRFHQRDGRRRVSARAHLVYRPATPDQPEVVSAQTWRLVVPLEPVEAGELAWYLERYASWPSHHVHERAKQVEANLLKWGRDLHGVVMPVTYAASVMRAWTNLDGKARRRFSIEVDAALEAGASDAAVELAHEAAEELLAVPWELIHDGDGYLFQDARPTRVRRRLPGTRVLDVPVVATPIRVLLVTARPDDDVCGYRNHRASALPLVEAMEALPGLVQVHVLGAPTQAAFGAELDRARNEKTPYHVVHLDGHVVHDRAAGMDGVCFELPEDADKLERRGHVTAFASELGWLLRDHRIPLVFLDAGPTAKAKGASPSVASMLLKAGVPSVIAMSHDVLVATARRFVAAFYRALAGGARVGEAMLAGQSDLKDDPLRGQVFGEGQLRLEDWFVPVLFQEKDDPQLFQARTAEPTREASEAARATRLGELPAAPPSGFIGRSRELLALQRLLRHDRYAVVRGPEGEGKTALAAELARWMVRSQQIRRAAFVSLARHPHVAAILDAVGRQLVGEDYAVARFVDIESALVPVERALAEQTTLLVADGLEAASHQPRRDGEAILALWARLNATADTRLVLTSREPLPAPFDAERSQRALRRLHLDDAVELIARALNAAAEAGGAAEATREEIEQLVEAAHGHAATLARVAPMLRSDGVAGTRAALLAGPAFDPDRR